MNAVVALGSNLGDRFDFLQKAVNKINSFKEIEILKISSVYETLPVGGPEQGNYLNATITANKTKLIIFLNVVGFIYSPIYLERD